MYTFKMKFKSWEMVKNAKAYILYVGCTINIPKWTLDTTL